MAIIKEELRLTDLIEVSTLQKMQDAFAAMTGVAVITTDSNGVAVTEPSDFSDFCINYVRSTEAGCNLYNTHTSYPWHSYVHGNCS